MEQQKTKVQKELAQIAERLEMLNKSLQLLLYHMFYKSTDDNGKLNVASLDIELPLEFNREYIG